MRARATAPAGSTLTPDVAHGIVREAFEGRHVDERVLVLIPDHTRTVPLPMLYEAMLDALAGAASVTFMVALGTHPPLPEDRLRRLVGLGEGPPLGSDGRVADEARSAVRIVNHAWNEPDALVSIGTLTGTRIRDIAGERWHPTLGGDVDVRINRAVLDHDHVIILGPTFPHEVVGFSGGAKYFFPGISEADMIDVTHWLGALAGVRGTIGLRDTPVRAMIHAAAEFLATPATLAALVVDGGELAGIFVGDPIEAWHAAVDLSQERHVRWVREPFGSILSVAPPMYDELWTAGKAMYKLEPVLAEGGELIILAPHLREISHVHGRWIREIGYHVLPYFLAQWERFRHVPLGILAHSTHVRGDGEWVDGEERPRAQVTLASRIPADECAALSLGYRDPASIDPDAWRDREDEGILYVPKAGETLYRVADPRP